MNAARLVLLALSLISAAAHAAPVVCPVAEGGAQRRLQIPKVKQAAQQVRRELVKKGLHVLDLPVEGIAKRRSLEAALNEERWCDADEVAAGLASAIALLIVDAAFVTEKVARLQEFADRHRDAKVRAQLQKIVTKAQELLAKNKVNGANAELNRAYALALADKDPWALPQVRADEDAAPAAPSGLAARTAAELDDDEVAAGCPQLGKRGQATSPELAAVMERLRGVMNERGMRVLDIQRGPELAVELARHLEAHESAPAARIACAFLKRVSGLAPNLGLAMARFHHVTRLRDEKGIPAASRERFSELVRVASEQVARRQFEQALASLDELLVLLGEPARPSETLPRAPGR